MAEGSSSSEVPHEDPTAGLGRLLHHTSFRHLPTVAVLLSIPIMWVVLALVLWQSRTAELEEAGLTVANLARLLDEQTYRVFQTTDLALKHAVERLERLHPAPNDAAYRGFLRSMQADLPHVRAFFVIGADGFIAHDTNFPDTPHINLADRSYFTVHRSTDDLGLHIGQPLRSRRTGTWFVPVSRRLDNPDGSFAGVIAAAIEPQYFQDFYRELNLGADDAVALFGLNATLIARVPELPDLVGQTLPNLNLFGELGKGALVGTFPVRNFAGVDSLLGFSQVRGYPLVAVATLSIPDVLTAWKRFAIVATVGAASITAMVLILSYLSDRRRRDREAAIRSAMQTQKMEVLGRMTGSVAHDFGNVLNVIASSYWLMRRNGASEDLIATGEQAVERGKLLTKQLLGFARRRELNLEPGDPNELLRELEPMLKHVTGPQVQVALDFAAGDRLCLIDRTQFDAAIMNLVINAAQAMPEGGRIVITSEDRTACNHRTSAARKLVSVRVRDTGQGIAPADLPRIFEPFFTTKQEFGTGLGLAQVHEFMKQVGGEVGVQSELGSGTTVELLFPCLDPEAGSASHDNASVDAA